MLQPKGEDVKIYFWQYRCKLVNNPYLCYQVMSYLVFVIPSLLSYRVIRLLPTILTLKEGVASVPKGALRVTSLGVHIWSHSSTASSYNSLHLMWLHVYMCHVKDNPLPPLGQMWGFRKCILWKWSKSPTRGRIFCQSNPHPKQTLAATLFQMRIYRVDSKWPERVGAPESKRMPHPLGQSPCTNPPLIPS